MQLKNQRNKAQSKYECKICFLARKWDPVAAEKMLRDVSIILILHTYFNL